ncbi:unnamed protein product [Cunninghamella blakesleeana]
MFNWFYSPLVQVSFMGFVCLCCPGIFNSLSGLGAGGGLSSNIALIDTSNSLLYACFCISGFLSGSLVNKFGIKPCLTIGSLGYALYSASLWVYDVKQVSGFVIASGAILGLCAGVFWAAQGAIMMSYPDESNKGKFIAIFWALFNVGGILGSVISLGMNLSNDTGGVSTATYTAFVVIMLFGSVLSVFLANPTKVIRSDGTHVTVSNHSTWKDELKGALHVWRERNMVLLFPAFIASNWFYSYQFRVNSVYFNAPTRSLNGTMYWAMQIIASLLIGSLLDHKGFTRRKRALIAIALIFCFCLAVWIGGFIFQLTFNNDYKDTIHWTSEKFGGPFVLYILYGFTDALYQSYLYWLMGAMSNDPSILSRYAGFYKALQSAGAAISFGIDAANIPLKWECLICWILIMISFPPMFIVANSVSDTNVTEDVSTEDKKAYSISMDDEKYEI